jgi:SAM-dependent methyltransferase
MVDLKNAEAIEDHYWRTSSSESPEADSVDNILNKAAEARIFVEKVRAYSSYFSNADTILELGAGQCWASCLVKKFYPEVDITATDLSEAAVQSVNKWANIFGARPDRVRACRAYETPFADNSFQLIFAFAAAHHFRRYGRSMAEISRILAPGGVALFFHEPSCTEFMYKSAFAAVNKRHPNVPEDVLVRPRLAKLAKEHNLSIRFNLSPTLTNRAGLATVYFYILSKFGFLAKLLPCSADIVVEKPFTSAR